MLKKAAIMMGLVAVIIGMLVAPATASDHLFNAAHAPGAAMRGFANPVAGNPSGTSGPRAMPATVPGEGDPKAGADTGTPAVSLDLVSVRSGGHGGPTP